jgi:ammonia channel protein AmtB
MKKSFMEFLTVLGLFIWGLVAIATSAAVWNSHPSVFIGIVAGLNLAINGLCIYATTQLLKKKKEGE